MQPRWTLARHECGCQSIQRRESVCTSGQTFRLFWLVGVRVFYNIWLEFVKLSLAFQVSNLDGGSTCNAQYVWMEFETDVCLPLKKISICLVRKKKRGSLLHRFIVACLGISKLVLSCLLPNLWNNLWIKSRYSG